MLEFQEKRRLKQILSSKITLAVVLVVAAFLARSTWGVYRKYQESEANLQVSQAEYDSLVARRDELAAEVARLQTSRGVEEEIRDKFQVARPGEQVALIIGATSTVETTEVPALTFWQKVKAWF